MTCIPCAGDLAAGNCAEARARPLPSAGMVAIDPRARRAWGALAGVAALPVGTIIVGLGGEVLRIRDDGGAEEISAVPRRWSVSADPSPPVRDA